MPGEIVNQKNSTDKASPYDAKKIVVIEDNLDAISLLRVLISDSQHSIEAVATNYTDAYRLAGKIACGAVRTDIVLLDARLESKQHNHPSINEIYQQLIDTNENYWVVGFAVYPLAEYGIKVDVDMCKEDLLSHPDLPILLGTLAMGTPERVKRSNQDFIE